MSKHLLLSTLFLTICTALSAKVYVVSNPAGNEWFPATGLDGSLMKCLDSALTNAGRDTIVFSLAGGTVLTANKNPVIVNDNGGLFINGLSTLTSTSVVFNFSLQITGSAVKVDEVDFNVTAFAGITAAGQITGSNDTIQNSTVTSSNIGFEVTSAGSNNFINNCTFQSVNHTLLLTGSTNKVSNSSFITTGAWQNSIWINGGTGNIVDACTFTSSMVHAISIENGGNHTIQNCTMTNISDNSIMIRGTGNNTISNCSISNSAINGIGIIASNNTIDNSTIFNNNGAGVIVENGNGNTISNSDIYDNNFEGIGIQGTSSGNTVSACKIHGNNKTLTLNAAACPIPVMEQGGIKSNGGTTIVENCFIYSNAANGVLIYDAGTVAGGANSGQGANSIVRNNTIGRDDLGADFGNGWNGAMSWGANGININNNTIVNNGKGSSHNTFLCGGQPAMPDRISGIRMQQVTSGVIDANYIGTDAAKAAAGNDFDGITLHTNVSAVNVTNNIIANNGFASAYGNGGGIALRNTANNNYIQSNSIGAHLDGTDGGNNDYGIDIEGCSGNTIGGTNSGEGNVIAYSKNTGNQGCGIWVVLLGATGNTIDNNIIRDHAGDGILIERGAIGNTIGTSNGGNIILRNENGINVKRNVSQAAGGNNVVTGNVNPVPSDGANGDYFFNQNTETLFGPKASGNWNLLTGVNLTTNNNTLRYNSFACNTNKGIQLSDNGNNMFGYNGPTKEVTTVTADPRPNFVSGKAPAGSTVDIYSTASSTLATCAATCKDANYQGATYTGDFVIADASGNWEYDFVANGNKVDQSTIVVLATETPTTAGVANTSEFSNCGCSAPSNVSLSANDSSLCAGQTAALLASATKGSGNYLYKWYTGANIYTGTLVARQINDSTLDVTTAGTYFVYVADMQDTIGCSDSSIGLPITVTPLPAINVVPAANSICTGQTTTIDAGATGATPGEVIAWSTGASTNQIPVSTGGTYTVTITNAENCQSSGSAVITENPTPNPVLSDQFFCQGDDVTFDAGAGTGYTYLWTPNNETSQTITVTTEGTYGVTVTAGSCTGTASAFADESPFPKPTVTIAGTDTICLPKGESANLVATVTAGTTGTYVWSKGASSDSLISINDTGLVSLTFTDTYGCNGSADFTIVNYCVPPTSNVPNVFIPGGTDNPVFTPVGTITPSDVLESHFEVYNRWGRKMFETTDFPIWDGSFKGNAAASGVYFWIWNYTDVTQTSYNLNGFVHLIRK